MRPVRWMVSIGLFAGAAAGAAQTPAAKPVISVMALHDAMITPASDALFDVGRTAPKDDTAWKALRNNLVILTESGNLLMTGGRAKDKVMWAKFSKSLTAEGLSAIEAADGKNVDGLLMAGERIVIVCEDCHEKYRDHGRSMRK